MSKGPVQGKTAPKEPARKRKLITCRGVDVEFWELVQKLREDQQRELGGVLNEALQDLLRKHKYLD